MQNRSKHRVDTHSSDKSSRSYSPYHDSRSSRSGRERDSYQKDSRHSRHDARAKYEESEDDHDSSEHELSSSERSDRHHAKENETPNNKHKRLRDSSESTTEYHETHTARHEKTHHEKKHESRRSERKGQESALKRHRTHHDHHRVSGGEKEQTHTYETAPVTNEKAPAAPVRSAARNTVTVQTNPVQQFLGRYGDNYAFLSQHTAEQEFDRDEFHSLGRVSTNRKYYFDESLASVRNANDFLEAFWSSEANRDATVEFHQQKYQKTDRSKPLNPGCISFVMAEIDRKPYCFITISSSHAMSRNLTQQLQDFIREYNRSRRNRDNIEFALASGDSRNFCRLLIRQGASEEDIRAKMKKCAEKDYASALTKLYATFGNEFKVTGVANYDFYPYKSGSSYGNTETTKDASVTPPTSSRYDSDVMQDDLLLTRKPCCAQCQDNKQKILAIFKTAQKDGAEIQEARQYITSPLRNSFSGETSLLQAHSLYPPARVSASDDHSVRVMPSVPRHNIKVRN